MRIYTLAEAQANIPTDQTVAIIAFGLKAAGDLHDGHREMIRVAKENAQFVQANIWNRHGFMELFFGDSDPTVDDPYPLDLDYMTTWLEGEGVDLIWTPDKAFYQDWFQGYTINEMKSWCQNIVDTNGLTFDNPKDAKSMVYYLTTARVLKQKAYYRNDYRIECWKDGYLSLYRKYLNNKYGGPQTIIIPPVLRPDGIPYASCLREKDPDTIEKLSPMIQFINNADPKKIKNNWQEFKARVQQYCDNHFEGTDNVFTELKVFHNQTIWPNRALLKLTITTRYNSEYNLFWYLKPEDL